jgi:hypothetical protein
VSGCQWLVFRNDGTTTAADYARQAAHAAAEGRPCLGDGEFLDAFDAERPVLRRRTFVLCALRQALAGLAFMHDNGRLHQSVGPSSLVLDRVEER